MNNRKIMVIPRIKLMNDFFFNCFKSFHLALVFFLLSGCYSDVFLSPGRTNAIDPLKWEDIKMGMSKDQVIDLIGPANSKHEITVGGSDEPNGKSVLEYWEYNYHSPPFSDPHPKAYVIYFDKNGLVSKLRKPVESGQ